MRTALALTGTGRVGMGPGEYKQLVRFALAQLRAANGQHAFERLCRQLARVTISRNIMPATGPVGAGGDQGRNFESYTAFVPGRLGHLADRVGVNEADAIAFACTLQQNDLRSKVLRDVAAAMRGPEKPSLVVVYCEADIPVGRRHAIQEAALAELGMRVVIFDGNAIAEDLAEHVDDLGWVVAEVLQVRLPRHSGVVPRELPTAPMTFVNRAGEMADLDDLLARAENAAGPSVAVLSGMHGVGKTAFGSHWANLHRGRFHGGDLYGDFSRRRHPVGVDVSEVLGGFLRDLGVADDGIPTTLAGRQKLFRRMTADRRLLIFLDDVDQPAQVLAVLPSGRGSVVVATTNYRLDELVYEGARLINVEPLDAVDARRLLEEMAGRQRILSDPDAVDVLVELCAGLPIALRVCGGTLVGDSTRSVEWLASELTETRRRLKVLSGPGEYATEAVFDFAYRDLPAGAAVVYRRLGLHPGPDIVAEVAAVLADLPLDEANAALQTLYAAHLLQRVAPDRYTFHELVRLHAQGRADQDETAPDRENAVRRLIDWYYVSAREADWVIVRDRLRLTDRTEASAPHVPVIEQPNDAFAWFQVERPNVMAAIRVASEREWDERVWQFAEALWPLCASHKHFSEWVESHRLGVLSSQRLRNATVEARMRSQLARAYAELGEHELATDEMRLAHVAVAASEHRLLKASVAEFGGVCDMRRGSFRDALDAFREARRRFSDCAAPRGVALQDFHIGWALARMGKPSEALPYLELARDSLAACGDPISVGRVLVRRGEVLRELNRIEDARDSLQHAVEVMGGFAIRFEQAEALEILAELADAGDQPEVARRHRQHAFRLYKELGHPRADELFAALGEN